MKPSLLRVISLLCCILLCAGILVSCSSPANVVPLTALDQCATDDEKIVVSYDISEKIAKKYDQFEIRVYHDDEHNNLLASTVIDATKKEASVDTSYGKLRLELVGIHEKIEKTLGTTTVSVWADEYNFASLNGTFPVVYFTLELFSMQGESRENFEKANEAGKNIQFIKNVPTFISLERTAAYDWDKLPDKVHTLPNTTYEQSIKADQFHENNEIMKAYIKELHEVNPESKFNFYCVDNYPELIVQFFNAQGIGDDLYNATMISDGTASVSAFRALYNESFDDATAQLIYTQTKEDWAGIKAKAAAGNSNYLADLRHTGGTTSLWTYALTMANESNNIQWWCSRDNFTKNTASPYIAEILKNMKNTKIQYFGINDMLQNLSKEDQDHLKSLFRFDGEMFSASTAAGKKSLVILGTSPSGETNLEAYMKLLQVKYGDEYVIYYKGHPGYPTGLDEEKLAMFERNGVIDLEASIAAELILFYNPEVYLAGFSSTTYKSVAQDKFIAIFDQTKASGLELAERDGYADTPEEFYTMTEIDGQQYVTIQYATDVSVSRFNITTGEITTAMP